MCGGEGKFAGRAVDEKGKADLCKSAKFIKI